jgi:hypothetical protein
VNGLQLLAARQLDVVMCDALQVLSAVEQKVPVTASPRRFRRIPPSSSRIPALRGSKT